jgi:hypothetical protein
MNAGSAIFMRAGAAALVVLIGLPLLISPTTWGRCLGWTLPVEKDFANYLGRSLGGVALSIAIVCYLAARDPWQYRSVFDLVILLGIFLTVVHVHGFIKKSQPMIENLEILLYLLVSLLAWRLYPHPPA